MTEPTTPRYFDAAPPPPKPDHLANRAHWGAGLVMLFAVLVPLAYYGLRSPPPRVSEELLPMPREETLLTAPEERLLQLINDARAKEPTKPPPLKANPILMRVAQAHATNMARQRKPAEDLDGKDTAARVQEAGYHAQPGRLESNLMSSPTLSPEEVFRSWMDAPVIKAQMLDGHFVETGIGIARGDDGTGYCYQVLAAPPK
jgi:uncharacterized protein YkwD